MSAEPVSIGSEPPAASASEIRDEISFGMSSTEPVGKTPVAPALRLVLRGAAAAMAVRSEKVVEYCMLGNRGRQ
ncbi:hypothetical protein BBD39_06205 [Arsenophonus endosymbiont of Bemisia tabaci Asia II 3]|nr:hypothetical protein BBD39_06205 [Arsenophonus endosymbiont of Bemisia tabaci Asia II 3]